MRKCSGRRIIRVIAEKKHTGIPFFNPRETQTASRAEHKFAALVEQVIIEVDASAVAVPDRDARSTAVKQRAGGSGGLAASLCAGKGIVFSVTQTLPVISDHAGHALKIDTDIKFLSCNVHTKTIPFSIYRALYFT